ncbi:MAG: hypothetical protein JSV64_02200, partial [Candidatus Bathyarchaeota archaeon]
MTFTEHDLAKYPFLPRAAHYIKQLDLNIHELTETPQIMKHAEERVSSSFQSSSEKVRETVSPQIEIASFPVSIMIVAAINDNYLKKRFALHEAKKIQEFLREENSERILEIAKFFKWKIKHTDAEIYPYALCFVNYLQNAASFRESRWKLVNRRLENGRVYLTNREATRLLQEEIRKYIETRLDAKITSLPSQINTIVKKLKNSFISQKPTIKQHEYPETLDPEAFPPCIEALYDAIKSGHHISHTGRFTLTTFLVNVGMPTESVLDLYRDLSDFKERLTRYQIEHLAGQRGSRTKYVPPTCGTLRTHGICNDVDKSCR